ncbi:NAD(P)-dependent alcohol dehydrogenase [Aureibaculum luteum]|uniref:NAD(P)-dependent alcohol dehydrogenase n=1 Tax=Aureibaculum luteum TaxID=1548456 RepID=UPI000E547AD2|nr:NAD(P)-dependent alcohol dehydrogenase [Aureibaculum luteum]
MKAIITTKYGSPDVLQLRNVEKPVPKDNEVLIKIYAATITTAGTMMRTGYPLIGRLFMGLTKPKNAIAGTGFSGKIEAIGEKVQLFKIGDSVFGESLFHFGTHAEYVCIEEEGIIALKPENISYEEAAVVGDGHITSMNFLKKLAKIKVGQRILINGASGSLGTAAVQIAKHFGAEITAVCSTRNLELVKSLGADNVIDYTHEDFTNNGKTYDIIYDTVGKSTFAKCKNSLTKNGAFISPVLSMSLLFQMVKTAIFGSKKALFSATGTLPIETIRTFLIEIKELMENGQLRSVIDRHYSLEQVADAHRYIETGHKTGNVVLSIKKK